MADALYHPYLQGYRFLIVGHTDGRETANPISSSASSAPTRSAKR